MRGVQSAAHAVLATVVLGLVAGGVAGVLFVTAQLTADPQISVLLQASVVIIIGNAATCEFAWVSFASSVIKHV
jgi:hypothetical protein